MPFKRLIALLVIAIALLGTSVLVQAQEDKHLEDSPATSPTMKDNHKETEPDTAPALPVDAPENAAADRPENAIACTPETLMLIPVDMGYNLTGTLEVPVPGYAYDLKRFENGDMIITLTPPSGMAAQVISTVNIDTVLPKELLPIHIALDKTFNWGPDEIICGE